MSKILTAEQVLLNVIPKDIKNEGFSYGDVHPVWINRAMIEFAKLHVQEALDNRDRLYETYYAEEIKFTEDNKKFIKKSYPLENIK